MSFKAIWTERYSLVGNHYSADVQSMAQNPQIATKDFPCIGVTEAVMSPPMMLVNEQPLSQKLREWRGKWTQKEAAAFLNVSIRSYQNWEYGINRPEEICMKCLLERMSTKPEGA